MLVYHMDRWDAQIAPSQVLISQLAKQRHLEILQLRLGTDHTPLPYFHSLLHFGNFRNLTRLAVIQIDKAEVLRSVGRLINSTNRLSEIHIEGDADKALSLATLFEDYQALTRLRLTTVDIRGFTDLNCSVWRLWEITEPRSLQELTLQIDGPFHEEDYDKFWLAASQLNISLNALATNAAVGSFLQFLGSFSGLSSMILSSNRNTNPAASLGELLHVLMSQHLESLKVLAIYPQGYQEQDYLLSNWSLTKVADTWRGLTELAFAISAEDIVSPS
jgi:hypothetical protein